MIKEDEKYIKSRDTRLNILSYLDKYTGENGLGEKSPRLLT